MNIFKYSFMLLSTVMLAVSACSNDEPFVRYEPVEPGPEPEPGDEYVVVCDFETSDLQFQTNDALEYSVVENPAKEGSNESDHCGQVISGGGQWELIFSKELPEPFEFSADGAKFTMKVNSPKVNGKIYFKLEGPGVDAKEITNVASVTSNRWETLTYDFTDLNLPSGKYNKIVLLFDAGESGSGERWLFDDIFQMKAPGAVDPSPDERQENYSDFETSDLEFRTAGSDDMQYEVIANPVPDGNDSEHVARVVTGSGQWELLYSKNLEKPFAFSKYGARFSVKVYAPKAGAPIYMKLESSSGAAEPKEITSVVSSAAGKWATYTFNFAPFGLPDYTYDRILLLFDAGVTAPGETWYFDDVIGPKGEKKSVVEPAPLIDFCNFEDVALNFHVNDSDKPMRYEVIENPYKTGINTSDHVGHVVSGGHQWELLWSEPMADPLVFSRGAVFTMKVYSPKANGKVYFKVEDANNVAKEITNVVVPNAGEWTELTFDFSPFNLSNGQYTKIILLFDAGETGSGEDWYFDDIKGPDNKTGTLMKRVGSGPVLTYGNSEPAWRRDHVANAAILTPAESPDGKWRMYVRGSGTTNGAYHDQIGLFTQEVAGFKPAGPWTEYPSNPIITHGAPGTCDELHLLDCAPCVGADGKVWFFYQAVRGTLDSKQGSLACRRSTDDGISFTAATMLRDGVGCSDVVYHDGKYYIYYGYGYNNGLMKVDCAVTSDPETLAAADIRTVLLPGGGPSDFDAKSVNGSRIFRLDGVDKWFMVYQGSDRHFDFPDRFHVAYSDDLLNWTKVENARPFFERGNAGRWDQGGIWFGEVFEHDGTLYMYYEGWGCEGSVPDRDEPYFWGGHSSTGCASVDKEAFLQWCGLQ